ncbi:c-type cytochrome domain-containing protein [Pelagicoccus mobilis]|uniref:Cytochrome C Planctomycete-type domain-containing protein n=1 Tax=Pelagicoccus mobilis TaxID=415221 RepID=A0A934RVR1_9BACT|nr:c-type cytochrome domain-containing protein [Pelagicoccus mobilis]MBK1878605.1 hypothetical protein [Pelagicoccus mobilis]
MKRALATLYLLLAALFAFAPLLFEAGEEASSPWTPFIASFHPLVLHLPIGLVAAVLALEFASIFNKHAETGARNFLWFLTALTASLSFATGYLLGEEGGYEKELLNDHLWAAGIFTSICWSTLAVNILKKNGFIRFLSLIAITATLVLASHPGGLMVHGDPFANAPWLAEEEETSPEAQYGILPLVPDPFNPYTDVVHPIIDAKCVSCHGPKKKKGKLRVDTYEALMLGGDFGPCIEPGDSYESLFVELMELPMDDEEHMPPEDEHQMTQEEIDVIKWWIDEGAKADVVMARAEAPAAILPFLVTGYRLLPEPTEEELAEAAEEEARKADEANRGNVEALLETVSAEVRDSVQFMSLTSSKLRFKPNGKAEDFDNDALEATKELVPNFVRIDLSDTAISNNALKHLKNAERLEILSLRNTEVDEDALEHLEDLENLESLNLYGTPTGDDILKELPTLPNLRTLYLGETKISTETIAKLQTKHPEVEIIGDLR